MMASPKDALPELPVSGWGEFAALIRWWRERSATTVTSRKMRVRVVGEAIAAATTADVNDAFVCMCASVAERRNSRGEDEVAFVSVRPCWNYTGVRTDGGSAVVHTLTFTTLTPVAISTLLELAGLAPHSVSVISNSANNTREGVGFADQGGEGWTNEKIFGHVCAKITRPSVGISVRSEIRSALQTSAPVLLFPSQLTLVGTSKLH